MTFSIHLLNDLQLKESPIAPWAKESGSTSTVGQHGYGKRVRTFRGARQFQGDEELPEPTHSLQRSSHRNGDLF